MLDPGLRRDDGREKNEMYQCSFKLIITCADLY
jgi:hypothetical protein